MLSLAGHQVQPENRIVKTMLDVGARLSFADDGLTFGTNHHLGLCVEFVEKIPKVVGPRPHSALWVSVADPDGLATALGC